MHYHRLIDLTIGGRARNAVSRQPPFLKEFANFAFYKG